MIRYKLTTKAGDVLVSVDSEQPHKVAPIHYDGEPRAVLLVKRWLSYETGADGRIIGDWCAPADLKATMSKNGAGAFSPSLEEEQMGMKKKVATDAEGGG
jgi:hypothetical protein